MTKVKKSSCKNVNKIVIKSVSKYIKIVQNTLPAKFVDNNTTHNELLEWWQWGNSITLIHDKSKKDKVEKRSNTH